MMYFSNSDALSRENYEKLMLNTINDIDSDEQMIKSFRMFCNQESEVITIEELKAISKQLDLTVTDEEIQVKFNKSRS